MSNLTSEEKSLTEKAVAWARANKRDLSKQLTDKSVYPTDVEPVALFMAGCPGAGKTEVAKALKRTLDERYTQSGGAFMLIDPDEIRKKLPGYDGANADLFQHATSIIVDGIFDRIMRNKQSFILDGTLSDCTKARQNIERCLKRSRNYLVILSFIYNDPLNSWRFAKAREKTDGRAITISVFIDRYFASKESVRILKQEFGQNVRLDLLFKDLKQKTRPEFNIKDIDNYLDEKYTPASLRQALLNLEVEDADS